MELFLMGAQILGGLALFLINIIGALLFYPFLKPIGRMEEDFDELEIMYRKKYIVGRGDENSHPMIDAMYPSVPQDLERISDHANNIAEHVMRIT